MPDTQSSPSAEQRQLMNMIHRVGFGRIEHLAIRNGQPEFNPQPRIVREIKFGSPTICRDAGMGLSVQMPELFAALQEIGDGMVDLEIRHGLPFRLIVAEGGQP